MPPPSVPTKTPLGQDEMRRRSSGLGQRHRTILFLIDGRRTLAEVLSLAQKAGAATSHFEDLVRLGYVELPPEETTAAPLAAVEAPAAGADGEIRHLELEVPAEAVAVPPEAEIAVEAAPAPEALAVVPPPVAPAPVPPPTAPPEPIAVPAVAAAAVPAAAAPKAPPARPSARMPAAGRTPLPPPAPANEERPLLENARASVLDALRFDSQPSGNRIAERARQAPTLAELVEVVWIMERGIAHSQRSHRGLLALQRARELLGLGNTLVDEESRPGRLDDDW